MPSFVIRASDARTGEALPPAIVEAGDGAEAAELVAHPDRCVNLVEAFNPEMGTLPAWEQMIAQAGQRITVAGEGPLQGCALPELADQGESFAPWDAEHIRKTSLTLKLLLAVILGSFVLAGLSTASESASMRDLGQFFAGPGAVLSVPGEGVLAGIAVLILTLVVFARLLPRALRPDDWLRLPVALVLAALAGVGLVLLVQFAAEMILEASAANPEVVTPAITGGGKPRMMLGRVLILLVCYLIGWGYSLSAQTGGFGLHLFGFVLGAGFVEEVTKLILAMMVCALLFEESTDVLSDRQRAASRRYHPLAPMGFVFLLAGLGFGAGEALYYFQVYAAEEVPLWVYVMRATWCVGLHGAWSMLTGLLLITCSVHFEKARAKGQTVSDGVEFAAGFAALLPAILLHALYDAACLHSNAAMWLVGGASLACLFIWVFLLRRPPSVIQADAGSESAR